VDELGAVFAQAEEPTLRKRQLGYKPAKPARTPFDSALDAVFAFRLPASANAPGWRASGRIGLPSISSTPRGIARTGWLEHCA